MDEDAVDVGFLIEAPEIEGLIARVIDSGGKDAISVHDRFKAIVSTLRCTRHGLHAVHARSQSHAGVLRHLSDVSDA